MNWERGQCWLEQSINCAAINAQKNSTSAVRQYVDWTNQRNEQTNKWMTLLNTETLDRNDNPDNRMPLKYVLYHYFVMKIYAVIIKFVKPTLSNNISAGLST